MKRITVGAWNESKEMENESWKKPLEFGTWESTFRDLDRERWDGMGWEINYAQRNISNSRKKQINGFYAHLSDRFNEANEMLWP